ncbi:hypothetical protein DFH11DRAFT_1731524 [Phellopilus nigrolimitatus]|nr:hypothetical protein DFH11DRAFT_1731524 [Phellopilus nigrolimitatus]
MSEALIRYGELKRERSLESEKKGVGDVAVFLFTPVGASANYFLEPSRWAPCNGLDPPLFSSSASVKQSEMSRELVLWSLYRNTQDFNIRLTESLKSLDSAKRTLARHAFKSTPGKSGYVDWYHGLVQALILDHFSWANVSDGTRDDRLAQKPHIQKLPIPSRVQSIHGLYVSWPETLKTFVDIWDSSEASISERVAEDKVASGSAGVKEADCKVKLAKVENNFCMAALGLHALVLRQLALEKQRHGKIERLPGKPSDVKSLGMYLDQFCNDLPRSIADMDDYDLLRPLYAMVAISPISLLSPLQVTSSGSNKLPLFSLVESMMHPSLGVDVDRYKLEFTLLNTVLDMAVHGRNTFRSVMAEAVVEWRRLTLGEGVSHTFKPGTLKEVDWDGRLKEVQETNPIDFRVVHQLSKVVCSAPKRGVAKEVIDLTSENPDWLDTVLEEQPPVSRPEFSTSQSDKFASSSVNMARGQGEKKGAVRDTGNSLPAKLESKLKAKPKKTFKQAENAFEGAKSEQGPTMKRCTGKERDKSERELGRPIAGRDNVHSETGDGDRTKGLEMKKEQEGDADSEPEPAARPGGSGKRHLSTNAGRKSTRAMKKRKTTDLGSMETNAGVGFSGLRSENATGSYPGRDTEKRGNEREKHSDDHALPIKTARVLSRAFERDFTRPPYTLKFEFRVPVVPKSNEKPNDESSQTEIQSKEGNAQQYAKTGSKRSFGNGSDAGCESIAKFVVRDWTDKNVQCGSWGSMEPDMKVFKRMQTRFVSGEELKTVASIMRPVWMRMNNQERLGVYRNHHIHVVGGREMSLFGIKGWDSEALGKLVDMGCALQCHDLQIKAPASDPTANLFQATLDELTRDRKAREHARMMSSGELDTDERVMDVDETEDTSKRPCHNYPYIPLAGDVMSLEFDDVRRFLLRNDPDYTWRTKLGPTSLASCWMLAAHRSAYSKPQIDSAGTNTRIHIVDGAKMWLIAQDKGLYPKSSGFDNADTRWEVVYLRRGDDFYMHPCTPHAALTTIDCLSLGGRFYSCLHYDMTLRAIVFEHYYGVPVTNTEHPKSPLLLMKSMMGHVYEYAKENGERQHFPSIEQLSSLLILLNHLNQLAPASQFSGHALTNAWQGSAEFEHDFVHTLKLLIPFVEGLVRDGHGMAIAKTEEEFALLIDYFNKRLKYRRYLWVKVKCMCGQTHPSNIPIESKLEAKEVGADGV